MAESQAKYGANTSGKEIVKDFPASVNGKTFLITGPSEGGIGAQVALDLAGGAQPAKLILAGRNSKKIEPVIQEIRKANTKVDVEFLEVDLASLKSVREAAQKFNRENKELHGLFLVAGLMAVKTRKLSPDNNEMQFATNHLGHFLFTNLVMPTLIAAHGAVYSVSSDGYGMDGLDFNDPNFEKREYNPWIAYSQSKTANVLFAEALTSRLKSKGVVAFTGTPGLILGSKLQVNNDVPGETWEQGLDMGAKMFGVTREQLDQMQVEKSLDHSASTLILPMVDPSWREKAPVYFRDCAEAPLFPHGIGPERADQLWKLSEKLVGETFAY